MVEQAQATEVPGPDEAASDGKAKLGRLAAIAVGAAAGLAILGAPVAATLAAGVIGPLAFEGLKTLRKREAKSH